MHNRRQSAGKTKHAISNYISGFVDGEGSFHVAIHKTTNVAVGWQVIPEFHVSQNQSKPQVLKLVKRVLDCGYIKPNHRYSNEDKTNVLVVRNRNDLWKKVIPFFRKYPMLSCKQRDFEKFATVVALMLQGRHLKVKGLKRIIKIGYSMNNNGIARRARKEDIIAFLESSETTRQGRKKR